MSDPLPKLGLTVGEIRRALDGQPDEMEVTVRAHSKDGNSICGAITGAGTATGCDEDEQGNNPLFFAIEVSDDPDDFPR